MSAKDNIDDGGKNTINDKEWWMRIFKIYEKMRQLDAKLSFSFFVF